MFNWLLEKEPVEEEIQEEEEEEEEEEEAEPSVDEQALYYNRDIAECFALFDPNNTNKMEEKYLKKALACLGIFLSGPDLEDTAAELETNGYIPFDKFQAYAYDKMVSCDPIEALRIAFQAFDPDKEGFVFSDRLRRWMTTLGDALTEKEAKELVRMGDPGNRGVVLYEDLVNTLIKG